MKLFRILKELQFATLHSSPCISCILQQSLEVCRARLPCYKSPPQWQLSSSKAYVSLVAPLQSAVSKLPPSEMVLREIGNQITMHESTEILFPRLKMTVRYNLLLCWKTLTVAPEPRAPFTIELWFNESLIINPPCQRNKRQKKNNSRHNLYIS